mmetsp:Transcript_42161/g.30905  ORF Transcript_42161/g.30905 Transcript_42161/m.30905 type:complete len:123 (+) Transcript_42161:153-521(+)
MKEADEHQSKKKIKSSLNRSAHDSGELPNFNTVRDNVFFNKFAVKYQSNLQSAFEEIDKNVATKDSSFNVELKSFMDNGNELRKAFEQQQQEEKKIKVKQTNSSLGSVQKIKIQKIKLIETP